MKIKEKLTFWYLSLQRSCLQLSRLSGCAEGKTYTSHRQPTLRPGEGGWVNHLIFFDVSSLISANKYYYVSGTHFIMSEGHILSEGELEVQCLFDDINLNCENNQMMLRGCS